MTDREALLDWYDAHRRELPWRVANADAYRVLVSELMLQQTTVETVKPRFTAFVERFPSIVELADADIDDVLHAWQGLGYYRRARALFAAAQRVCADHHGQIPSSVEALMALPGVGRYTAAAVAAIAFDQPVVPVDGNIARIVARLHSLDSLWPVEFAPFQQAADGFVGDHRAGDVAQALMDLGSAICRPRKPTCLECPIAASCDAFQTGYPEDFPKKPAKKAKRQMFAAAFLVVDDAGRVQFRKRPETGLLAGLIELPTSIWQTEPFENLTDMLANAPATILSGRVCAKAITHIFTHIHLRIELVYVSEGTAVDAFWQPIDQIGELALPTLTKKLLKAANVEI